jgi:hypothetical protein
MIEIGIGYIIIIIIIGIIVSIITEQMLIRRLKLEEGVTISKGKCVLKSGYGLIPPPSPSSSPSPSPINNLSNPDGGDFSGIGRNNLTDDNLSKFFKPYLR